MIGKILSHPALAPVAPKIIEGFLSAILGKDVPGVPAIAGANGMQSDEGPAKDVIEALRKHDANLERHLQKLLALAETDNATFQQIIKAFD